MSDPAIDKVIIPGDGVGGALYKRVLERRKLKCSRAHYRTEKAARSICI